MRSNMAGATGPGQKPSTISQDIGRMRRELLSQFHVAFALMSIIPLLLCLYLITVKFFSLEILQGMNGLYFLLAVVFSIIGLLAGQILIRGVMRKLVQLNVQLGTFYEQQAAFVSNVSHEFRTPLSIIKGALDNMADGLHGELSTDQLEPVNICRKEANRLKRLVGDLLDVSKLEAGKMRLITEPVELQELLRGIGKAMEPLIRQRGLTLSLELPAAPVTVLADKDRLNQVFVNLITNAMKFTERGGLTVRVVSEDDAAEVIVSDTGLGIRTEDLDRIFNKFERVGPETQEGWGLGLPIAKALIELHRGRIWAESEPGRGSRFIVRLPYRLGAP